MTFNESINIEDSGIIPYFHGKGGAMITDLPQLQVDTIQELPSIIVIDIGQNDLCWSKNDPLELANDLYTEIKLMYSMQEYLELVVICYVTEKYKLKRGDKKVEKFCEDVQTFNKRLLCLTRRDKKIMRWNHRGCTKPTWIHSTDGTHPNTGYGFHPYVKSISSLCKAEKNK